VTTLTVTVRPKEGAATDEEARPTPAAGVRTPSQTDPLWTIGLPIRWRRSAPVSPRACHRPMHASSPSRCFNPRLRSRKGHL